MRIPSLRVTVSVFVCERLGRAHLTAGFSSAWHRVCSESTAEQSGGKCPPAATGVKEGSQATGTMLLEAPLCWVCRVRLLHTQ